MKKLVLKYGLGSGAILATMVAVMVPLCMTASIDQGELVGYSAMVLAFLLVFFGIRSYREAAGGAISFGKAFQVGILITVVASAVYVVSWEIVYFNFFPDFLDQYQSNLLEKMRAQGETAAAIEAARVEMAEFAKLYANPLFNVGVTFLEVFPVGLIVTLVSAAILRRRPGAAQPATPVTATT